MSIINIDEFRWQVAQRVPAKLREEARTDDENFWRLFSHSHYEPRPDIYGNMWLGIWFDLELEALEFFRDYRRDIYKAVADSGFWCGYILEYGNIVDRYFLCQIPTANASLLGVNSIKNVR